MRVIHPFPTLLCVAATALLAMVAVQGLPGGSQLWRMLIVMLLAQSAIGVTNDLADRDLDAVTKPWKPIVAGTVSLRVAVALAVAAAVVALSIAATFGALSGALVALGTSCGLAYDLRLKRTALSALPFVAAIPLLPIWVWTALGAWTPVLWWLLPLGGLIGLSLHLANTLPDLQDDAAQGIRGLAHRLGTRRSALVAQLSFALALALSGSLSAFIDYDLAAYLPALLVAVACLAISARAATGTEGQLRFGFGLLGIGAAVAAVGWLAAVG